MDVAEETCAREDFGKGLDFGSKWFESVSHLPVVGLNGVSIGGGGYPKSSILTVVSLNSKLGLIKPPQLINPRGAGYFLQFKNSWTSPINKPTD